VLSFFFFFFQAEDGIRDLTVTGVQTCALPIWRGGGIAGPQRRRQDDPDPLDHGTVAADGARRHHRVAWPRAGGPFAPRDRGPPRSEERRVGKEWGCRGVGAQ